MKRTLLTLSIIILFGHINLFAGWIIHEKTIQDVSSAVITETIMIQDQKMKTTSEDGTFIFNLKTDELTLVNDRDKVFWTGKIEDFRKEASEAMKSIVDELLEQFPEEQRAILGNMFDNMTGMYKEPDPDIMNALTVTIEKSGETENIAGFESRKYTVEANGKLVEKVWISSRPDISSEFDMKELHEALNQITPVDAVEDYYGFDDDYLELMSSGFVMRTVEPDGTRTEVTEIKETNIDDSEFVPGTDYRKVDLTEIFRNMMKDDDDK